MNILRHSPTDVTYNYVDTTFCSLPPHLRRFIHDVDIHGCLTTTLVIAHYNLRSVVSGQWLVLGGQWSVVSGQWYLVLPWLAPFGVDHIDTNLAIVHRHIDVLSILQLLAIGAQDFHCELWLLLALEGWGVSQRLSLSSGLWTTAWRVHFRISRE